MLTAYNSKNEKSMKTSKRSRWYAVESSDKTTAMKKYWQRL
jgi:hypothetical protein